MKLDEILERIYKEHGLLLEEMKVSEKRRKHIDGCVSMSFELSLVYGQNSYKAVLAALLHDYFRELDNQEIVRLARELKVAISDFDLRFPRVLHGKVAAAYFLSNSLIDDYEILEAIRHHTLGEAGTGNIAKLLFIADAAEEYRTYEGAAELRQEVLGKELDEAYVIVLKRTITDMIKKNKVLAPATIGAYNHMMEVNL